MFLQFFTHDNSSQFRITSSFWGGLQLHLLTQEKSIPTYYRAQQITMARRFQPVMNVNTFYNEYTLIVVIITHKI
jgi:hypothetical protein